MEDVFRSELRSLLDELWALDDAITLLAAQRTAVRAQIRQQLARLGGHVVLPGYGRLEITAPSTTVSYDQCHIEALIMELTTTNAAIAARIAACRTESPHTDGLHITPANVAA